MIILGLILMLLGFVLSVPVLWVIGIVLVVIGAVLWIAGSTGNTIGGRRHYWSRETQTRRWAVCIRSVTS